MQSLAVIPVRMESSRFFGKPLANICGIPMVAHCYERAKLCSLIDHVVVATPNKEIMEYCDEQGITTVLTSLSHERATERCQETLDILDKERKIYNKVILIQGDEPLTDPLACMSLLDSVSEENNVSNLVFRIDRESAFDRNIVKAVISESGRILFFSRSPIPYQSDIFFRQLGLIAFTPRALDYYVSLSQSTYEKIESIDMMRFIENGYTIKAIFSGVDIQGIDLPEHLRMLEPIMETDKYFKIYKSNYSQRL